MAQDRHDRSAPLISAGRARRLIVQSQGLDGRWKLPPGAEGAAQVVEVWKQMRGTAGARQVPGDVDLALTHNVGGTGQTCAVHIFGRK